LIKRFPAAVPQSPEYFEDLFQGSDDPWGFRSRWYETRKRAITLACLPQPRYSRAFEPGCANGELTAELATRCDELICSDGNARAIELARQRVAALAHVDVVQGWMPHDWPAGQFDLIVVSELGYFLSVDALRELARRINAALLPGGTVLACHWRKPIAGSDLTGDDVHNELLASLHSPHALRFSDADFRLDLWFGDGRSVGEVQGLR
jgi:SAM-dependent methyltransferase